MESRTFTQPVDEQRKQKREIHVSRTDLRRGAAFVRDCGSIERAHAILAELVELQVGEPGDEPRDASKKDAT